ncbi:FAD binding domain-containing protein [Roseivivax isoporae]|uniref:Carbon monoxide dehydrogenase medium subunit n=1 Tax=Roseivivax isoporae LMG 25204 TaxID=1449351 RepID=X7FAT1_9RHOB|nr:xanthine dehydrogenase family protein subunit M [Roseivivax isoporae]ETX29189.1 carbon monoxide dehydrogenase medium subunit [Roseivivax isoporae LMG 25204]
MTEVLSPLTVDDAIALLVEHDEAMPLAGGATLIAMRNASLVEPSHLVSLDRIAELRGIDRTADGTIRIGAMTRHCDTAACAELTGSLHVLRRAAGMIANRVVRNMGTMGGAVANADPAADYLPALACCDATLEIAGPEGRRSLSIHDYVDDWYETALGEGEIITAIMLPAPVEAPSAYRKIARVSGDYATASCAMALDPDGQGLRVAIGACGPGPLRDRAGEDALRGKLHDPAALAEFAGRLVALADPVDDVRGSAEYRLRLIPRLVASVLSELAPQKETA